MRERREVFGQELNKVERLGVWVVYPMLLQNFPCYFRLISCIFLVTLESKEGHLCL